MSLADSVRSVLRDTLHLPPEFLEYLRQHLAQNPVPLEALRAPSLLSTGNPGATQASRYVGATTSGSPATGTFVSGDYVIDRTGDIWICTVSGSPGTWVDVGGALIGPWQIAQPVAPASAPAGSQTGASLLNGWGNIAFSDGTYSPLRYRKNHGDVELVGAIDGGALGSVCIQLPAGFRPVDDANGVITSVDGTRIFSVFIEASTGNVTVTGVPTAQPQIGATGATGPQGATGPIGATGVGATGATGPQGATGPLGVANLLAYQEFDYSAGVGTFNVPNGSSGHAGTTDIVDCAAITLDGSTEVCIEFYSSAVEPDYLSFVLFELYDGSTFISAIADATTGQANVSSQVRGGKTMLSRIYLTPTAGSHTYSVRAFSFTGTHNLIFAGTNTIGGDTDPHYAPGHLRITRGDGAGPQGATGPTGAAGSPGGATGPAGSTGATGPIGATGSGGAASTDGWIDDTAETWTYVSGSGGGVATFTVTGDVTAKYTVGTRIKLTQTTVKYFVVSAAPVFAAGSTTVTIMAGSDYTLANAAISANFHSYDVNPQGYPGWFTYAPSPTGYTGAVTVTTARFCVNGRTCHVELIFTGTSNATTLTCTAPIKCAISSVAAAVVLDNGSTGVTPGRQIISGGGSTITFSVAGQWQSGGGFTNSGTKAVTLSMISYEI